jgi:hypothetical protein
VTRCSELGPGKRPRFALLIALVAVLATACGTDTGPNQLPPSPDYPARLARTNHDIAAAFESIERATDQPALANAVQDAAGTVSAAGQWLASGGPVPPALAQTNGTLTDALGKFATELAFLSQQINQGVICSGSTALGAITTAPSMAALRDASAQLARPPGGGPGFDWGGYLPAPRDQTNARMPTGRFVVDHRPNPPGDGVLQLHNEAQTDAVVILARSGSTLVEVSVRAGESTQVDGIPDGSYDVYYLTGSDWDDVVHGFGRQCEFNRFTGPSTFTSSPAPDGTNYTEETVTVRTTDSSDPGVTAVQPDGLPR